MSVPDSNDWIRKASDQVFRSVGMAAKRDLQKDPSGTQISQLVMQAQQLTDSIIRETVEYGPKDRRPACAEGCSACCHLHVVAHPMEVSNESFDISSKPIISMPKHGAVFDLPARF